MFRTVEELRYVHVEILLVGFRDFEVDDDVIGLGTAAYFDRDFGDVQILLDAVGEFFQYGVIEFGADDLVELAAQRIADVYATPAGDLDAFDCIPRVDVELLHALFVVIGYAASGQGSRNGQRQKPQHLHT